jgi:hypothetical protein
MRMRILRAAGLGALALLAAIAGNTVAGQERQQPPGLVITAFGGAPVTYTAPRTPWGDPDLQGVWSSDDMEGVPMAAGGGRGARGGGPAAAAAPGQIPPLYLDAQALAARQAQVTQTSTDRDELSVSTFRWDYARRAFPQTRLIVDPPDGRLPAVTAEAQKRLMPRGTFGNGPLDTPEDFSLYERCITRGIAGSVLRVIYGNGSRIVQGPGVVAFSHEMLPDTRLFYTDGRPHVGQRIRSYLGDSRARWEGEELVVETTNLTNLTAVGVNGNGVRHSERMTITERFRRVADDVLQYQATFDDPETYARPFTVSFPLTPLVGGVLLPYECHSGNTALSLALAAERAEDRAMAEAAAKGITRQRRGVQEGADAAAPPLLDRATGRGGSQGSAPRALTVGDVTGENTQEK